MEISISPKAPHIPYNNKICLPYHYSRFGWFLSQNPQIRLFTFFSISLAQFIEYTEELDNWSKKTTFEHIHIIKSGPEIRQNWALFPFKSNLINRPRQKMFFKPTFGSIWIQFWLNPMYWCLIDLIKSNLHWPSLEKKLQVQKHHQNY